MIVFSGFLRHYKTRLITILLVSIMVVSCIPIVAQAQNVTLPDAVEGFYTFPLRTVSIDTVSGKQGVWQSRNYRLQSGTLIKCQLIRGAAAKNWYLGSTESEQTDGVMGAGATYRTLQVLQFPALVESHPSLGVALAVKVSNDLVLSIESDLGSEAELIDSATKLLKMSHSL